MFKMLNNYLKTVWCWQKKNLLQMQVRTYQFYKIWKKEKKIKLNKRECPIPLVYIMAVQSVKKLKMVHKHVE